MLTKRIIPCLDVKDNQVVKGVRFRDHEVIGDLLTLAKQYVNDGADELVFYDITASPSQRNVDCEWITKIAKLIDIPFCVAGGINSLAVAQKILAAGADKISINSPALQNSKLISEIANTFGNQCVVVGIDSFEENGEYYVYQYTGDPTKTQKTQRKTLDWAREVESLGAGEIVLNCMNQDGMKLGYDISQLNLIKNAVKIPIIASGGAGNFEHFRDVFQIANVDGALAASVFHLQSILIPDLKNYLCLQNIEVRL